MEDEATVRNNSFTLALYLPSNSNQPHSPANIQDTPLLINYSTTLNRDTVDTWNIRLGNNFEYCT